MPAIFVVLFGVFCLMGFILLGLIWFGRLLQARWTAAGPSLGKRAAIALLGLGVISAPYTIFKLAELRFVLNRVPAPLRVAWIEYRLEESWGIGMPGDNETGFVVYRLTRDTTYWARSKGVRLGEFLPGARWHHTPLTDISHKDRWNIGTCQSKPRAHCRPTIRNYLGRYGFDIPLAKGSDAGANQAIQNAGSFYQLGRAGSVTIVDPTRGKVYFAYAG